MTEGRGTPGVALRTFGCKVNQVDSARIAADLERLGVPVVAEPEAAVVIVDSCTVTAEADAKVRKAVRHALRTPSVSGVVVTGCLANLEPAALEALGKGVVAEPDKARVAERAAALLAGAARVLGSAPVVARRVPGRTRAMVKVQEGCDAFCAYCIVPAARGGPRSEPLSRVVDEVRRLHEAGVREVVLTGTNIGRYAGEGGLAGLLTAVASTGARRIRLSSIEPLDLTGEMLGVAASIPAFMPHVHVPLQSGSDRVLSAMGRGYTAEEYLARLAAAREALGPVAVTTDVLVGFPGETEEDHAATVRLCEEAAFQRLHVFRYSPRPGTAAAVLRGRVAPETLAARAAELRALSERSSAAYREKRVGGTAEVLVERCDGGVCEGTSEDYVKVRFSLEGTRTGSVVPVRLTGLDGPGMHAAPVG